MNRRSIIARSCLVSFCLRWLLIVVLTQGILGCAPHPHHAEAPRLDPYYISGSKEDRETLRQLFVLLAKETENREADTGNAAVYSAVEFALVREIANRYIRLQEYGKLINFLTDRTNRNPQDPYNAYYLLMVAYGYIQQEAYPVAALYFDGIIKNYPDLTVEGQSIHLACLNQLITLVDNPEQKVTYYEELIARFSDSLDLGMTYFMLGQAYEQIGDWNGAIQSYTQYLPYRGTIIPGFPQADQYAKQLVDFNQSPKDWTFENLHSLVNAVKGALADGSSLRLRQYQAKVNFFARSWEQEDTDDSGMAEFNLADFMRGNQIQYADVLDTSSNAAEAYLRTSGWDQFISTWYFYFRKIYFPLNPDIHGRWEWAGVYYGEKF
ncbi:MAG: tetratricopeptide repeat protein [Treponema sp.]|nr:tetratricopeptide repeat protein [Treponema sp.]